MVARQWPRAEGVPPLVTITPFSAESIGDALRNTGFGLDSASDQAVANHRIYYYPFVISQPFVVVKMFAYNGLNSIGEDSDASVGVWDAKGNNIVNASFTSVSDDDNIMTEVDVTDTVLDPGLYYMGCVSGGIWHVFAVSPGADFHRLLGVLHEIAVNCTGDATFSTIAGTPRIHVIGITGRTLV